MTSNSLNGLITIMKWIALAILVLSALSILLKILVSIYQNAARRHVWQTDLDLIGKRARVTRTIRPWRPGQVCFREEAKEPVFAEAVCDKMIARGSPVLITAIREGRLRVLPVSSTGKPDAPNA
jgi:membrane-bound ClpP family serine protease